VKNKNNGLMGGCGETLDAKAGKKKENVWLLQSVEKVNKTVQGCAGSSIRAIELTIATGPGDAHACVCACACRITFT
jgi:hypothetical protein